MPPIVARSRRALGRLVGGLALAAPLVAAGSPVAAKKKKGKKCRPLPDRTAVASHCFRGSQVGSSRALELAQPFIPVRGGRVDRADLTAKDGPGGRFAVELRDLNQGSGVSNAPVIAAATVTIPAVAQGGERALTARFANRPALAAGFPYALVVRNVAGESVHYFKTADAATCFGPGDLQTRQPEEPTFTGRPGLKLEHTVYVLA